MQKTIAQLPEIKIIGISCRTNNTSEMNAATAKIGAAMHKYFSENLPQQIENKKNPGVTYSAYTEYESDFTGDYTYVIGTEVTSFDKVPEGCVTLTIPAMSYAKFTNGPGVMPNVCIDMWQKIWTMTEVDFGGQRSYVTDFEVYDERAADPQNTTLDIYVGIDKR